MAAEVKEKQRLSTRKYILIALSIVIADIAILASINALTPELWTGMTVENDKIMDVQFSKGFLTFTVKNIGDEGNKYRGTGVELVTVTEVIVEYMGGLPDLNQSVPYRVTMSIPIHAGEQASISVGYDWTSGETYKITLTTSKGTIMSYTTVAP